MKPQKPELSPEIVIYEVEEDKYAVCIEVQDPILRHYIYDADVWNIKQQHGNYAMVGIVSRLVNFNDVLDWIRSLTIDDVPAEFMEHHNIGAEREERLNQFRGSILGKVFGVDGDDDNEPTE